MGDQLANWKCVCGRGPSIKHSVNGYCSARITINDLKSQNEELRKALEEIANLYSEGSCNCADWCLCEAGASGIAKEALAKGVKEANG